MEPGNPWQAPLLACSAAQPPLLQRALNPPTSQPHPLVLQVLKKLRRLPWAQYEPYLLKTLVRATHKGRFSQIPHIASLAAGLARYHPTLGVLLVDEVLEAVEAGLETPEAGYYQRRVAAVRLLGELYNYKLVNSHVIFSTLHLILAYAHEPGTPPEVSRWVWQGAGRRPLLGAGER